VHSAVRALGGARPVECLHRFRSGHNLTIETGSEHGQDVVEGRLERS